MKEKVLNSTREVIIHCLVYVKGRTLDLGAGTAKYKGLLKQKTSEYLTLDLFPGENIDIIASITETGLANDAFDTVVCTQVFEHLPKPWEAVMEIRRLLKSGGVCIVTAPFIQPYHADPHDYYRYTVEGMKAMFSDGFNIVEAAPYTKFFATLAESARHLFFSPYKKNWPGKSRLVRSMASFAKILDKFVKVGRVYGNVYLVAKKN